MLGNIYPSAADAVGVTALVSHLCDDGIGIPEELSENIFKPFIRGDKARKSDGGTGLGLSIAQKIIKEHGGTLTLIRNRGDEKTILKYAYLWKKKDMAICLIL